MAGSYRANRNKQTSTHGWVEIRLQKRRKIQARDGERKKNKATDAENYVLYYQKEAEHERLWILRGLHAICLALALKTNLGTIVD